MRVVSAAAVEMAKAAQRTIAAEVLARALLGRATAAQYAVQAFQTVKRS